jgi:N-formylglutamate amidohydrolase
MTHFEIHEPKTVIGPLLVHIPHSATAVPARWRSQIVLDDAALARELLAMTDHYTDELFAPHAVAQGGVAFVNGLSRLVFDPERFEDDSVEVMSKKGMGAVYTRTSDLRPLRRSDFSKVEREAVLCELFRPYAAALEQQVSAHLEHFGRCLILDGHSFPSRALPYEDGTRFRPDLCLGYDNYHADERIITALERVADQAGWSVGRNAPFEGSYVPVAHYRTNPQVVSVMIEMNRSRYMDEATGHRDLTP